MPERASWFLISAQHLAPVVQERSKTGVCEQCVIFADFGASKSSGFSRGGLEQVRFDGMCCRACALYVQEVTSDLRLLKTKLPQKSEVPAQNRPGTPMVDARGTLIARLLVRDQAALVLCHKFQFQSEECTHSVNSQHISFFLKHPATLNEDLPCVQRHPLPPNHKS